MWWTKLALEQAIDCLATKLNHSASWYINCAGYAFGADGWYTPFNEDEDIWQMYRDAQQTNNWEGLENELVSRILRDFPDWGLASGELAGDHEYVAFRIRRAPFFSDFHFMKYDGAKWSEKHGHYPVNKEWFKLEDIYEPEAWDVYNGTLFVFEKKS